MVTGAGAFSSEDQTAVRAGAADNADFSAGLIRTRAQWTGQRLASKSHCDGTFCGLVGRSEAWIEARATVRSKEHEGMTRPVASFRKRR